jgi:hypothetical protein
MASTYSTNLKLELIGTGEQAGTWGTTTNTNLGTALEQSIVGKADVAMSSTTITLTLTNSNAAQVGRDLRLNLTGRLGVRVYPWPEIAALRNFISLTTR